MVDETSGANLNLSTITKQYSDEEAAWVFFESLRWPEGPICPLCDVVNHADYLAPSAGTRTTRTGKNGVAAKELRRTLGVAYETAWFMAHRIADAMDQRPLGTLLSDTVEADETYSGDKAHGKRERGAANKTPVVSLVQRGGKVRSRVVTNVNGKNVKGILQANVSPDATLMTDAYPVCREPGKDFAAHAIVTPHTKSPGKNVATRTSPTTARQPHALHDTRIRISCLIG